MKLTSFLVAIPILVSAILCIGFYQTLALRFIHIGLLVVAVALLLSLFGIIRLFWIRKKQSSFQLWLQMTLLLLAVPICLFFINLSNDILNKEVITIVNQTGKSIDQIKLICETERYQSQNLEHNDSFSIGIFPDMDKNIAIEIMSTIDGKEYQNSIFLKRKTNGIFSPSIIAINDTFGLSDLYQRRMDESMEKRYVGQKNRNRARNYHSKTIEEHREHLKYIKTNGGLMAYLDLGEKENPPIMLVHGVPTSSWLYRHMAQLLVEKGYRVIAPDLLGFGASDKPPFIDLYHPSQQAERLIALMDTLNIPSWTHLMHDAGGLWSGELFLKAPDRIENIIFLNTIAYKEGFSPPLSFKYGKPQGKVFVGLYNYSLTAKWFMDFTLDGGIQPQLKVLSEEDRKGYWLPMTEGSDQAIYQFFTSFDDTFDRIPKYNDFYKNAGKNAMVIWGDLDDALVGKHQVPMLIKDLKIASQHVHQLENGIHFIQEERPEELVGYIDDFLK